MRNHITKRLQFAFMNKFENFPKEIKKNDRNRVWVSKRGGKNLRQKVKLMTILLVEASDVHGMVVWWRQQQMRQSSWINVEWESDCVCLWANAFCWANCNLSFLREINDVFKNQNENCVSDCRISIFVVGARSLAFSYFFFAILFFG